MNWCTSVRISYANNDFATWDMFHNPSLAYFSLPIRPISSPTYLFPYSSLPISSFPYLLSDLPLHITSFSTCPSISRLPPMYPFPHFCLPIRPIFSPTYPLLSTLPISLPLLVSSYPSSHLVFSLSVESFTLKDLCNVKTYCCNLNICFLPLSQLSFSTFIPSYLNIFSSTI